MSQILGGNTRKWFRGTLLFLQSKCRQNFLKRVKHTKLKLSNLTVFSFRRGRPLFHPHRGDTWQRTLEQLLKEQKAERQRSVGSPVNWPGSPFKH